MMLRRLLISFFLFHVLVSFSSAQTPHTQLLYQHDLDTAARGSFSQFDNKNGTFIAGSGWQATNLNSQLFIALPNDLPFEGTLAIDVTNFDPVSQNADTKQQIINLYSQSNGSKDIFYTNGSWANIRTGTGYSTGPGVAGFKFLAAPRGIDTRDEQRCIESATWDLNRIYEFRITWNRTTITCYLDGVEMSTLPFAGQIEQFRYIFIGTDNVYQAQAGPVYSNLRLYTVDQGQQSSVIKFTDITAAAGVAGYSPGGYGHGVTFTDVNRDGLLDIFGSNAVRAKLLPDMLFINTGSNHFSEEAGARGTLDVGVTHSILSADFDNDGDLDAFFSNMPSDDGQPEGRNALYRNKGNGFFEDITDWGGIVNENNGTRGAVAFDMDKDGDLDIYAANWGEENEMYLNDGNGRFTRVDRGANGPMEDKAVYGQQGVSAVDVDNDGDLDLYVCRRQESNIPVPNWLFINDGTGHFTEEAEARHVDYGGRSNGATFADVDNDGDLDLFVSNYHLPLTSQKPLLGVFFNNGDGTFTNKTEQYNIPAAAYNTAFPDIDNDGDFDMIIAHNNSKHTNDTPVLYLNDGHGQFTIKANSGIEVPAQDSRGVGYGDIDGDGDLDLYFACKYGPNFLLRNDLQTENHYIEIFCTGPKGDYGGYGSKVIIYESGHLGDKDFMLGYQEVQSNHGYLCQDQPAVHFGLGAHTSCDIRIIRTDGSTLEYQNVPADQLFKPTISVDPASPVHFRDITLVSGAKGYSAQGYAQGVSLSDLDLNGLPDIIVSNATRDTQTREMLYLNQGGNEFVEAAESRGVSDPGLTDAVVSADFDNDGDFDLFHANIPDAGSSSTGRNAMYRNDGSGNFSDISQWSGVAGQQNGSRGAIALDIENDGDLDLYVVNWGQPNEMYLNDGTGKMTLVDRGANGQAEGGDFGRQGVTAADFDNDGDVDIYVCRRKDGATPAPNWLFVNDGTGHFTEEAAARGVAYDGRSHGAVFGDVDNDGDLDLFVMNYQESGQTELPLLGVFFNNGDGTFSDRSAATNIRVSGYGLVLGDVDNDADLDMQLIRNNEKEPGAVPQILFNDGAGNFAEKWNTGFEVAADNARGAAHADIDNDGDLDFYIACRDRYNFLLRNDLQLDNHYIKVLCLGPKGDLGGVGSKVKVYQPGHLGDDQYLLGFQEVVTNFGYMSQNDPVLHFGLGNFTSCDLRIIRTDGQVFDFIGLAADQLFDMRSSKTSTISIASGNNQSGYTSRPLADPLIVRISNNLGGPLAGVPVTFTIEQGDGHIQGQQPVLTDGSGLALVNFVCGDQAGVAKIRAEAPTTENGSVLFSVDVKQLALEIKAISGDSQTGTVGMPLDSALTVTLQFNDGGSAEGETVRFQVIAGSGTVNGSADTRVQADSSGLASVQWTLGTSAGLNECVATAGDTSWHFTAEAVADVPDSLLLIQNVGDCSPGLPCDIPIVVKVIDKYHNPIGNFDVLATVLDSSSSLAGAKQQTVRTDTAGLASIYWTLGNFLGETNRLQVSAIYQGSHLANSPIIIEKWTGNAPSSSKSSISASSPITADGLSSSEILVTVRDEDSNPMPGFAVSLNVSGSANLLTPQDSVTNADGQFSAHLASTVAETKVIRAMIMGEHIHPVQLGDSVVVEFVPVAHRPDSLLEVSGNGQVGEVGAALASPFVVQILDEEGNPFPDYPVLFQVIEGGGSIDGDSSKTIVTNAGGFASATLTLGPSAGDSSNIVQVKADSLAGSPLLFIASALPGPASSFSVEGFDQVGIAGTTLDDSCRFIVTDRFANPLKNVRLSCSVQDSGFTINGEYSIVLNSYQRFQVRLGTKAGEKKVKVVPVAMPDSVFTFALFVLPDRPAKLTKVSGDSQTVVIGSPFPEPLVVLCTDKFLNPLGNVDITFISLDSSAQVITPQPVSTDSTGRAYCQIKGGMIPDHLYRFLGILADVDSVLFSEWCIKPVLNVQSVSPDTQMVEGGHLRRVSIEFQVSDSTGSPLVEREFQIELKSGNAQIIGGTRHLSDQNGHVVFEVQVGPDAGTIVFTVRSFLGQAVVYEKDYTIIVVQPTGVVKLGNESPDEFALMQNYPNPFNPTTTIAYQLPRAGDVTLTIYNLQGQVVSRLVDGVMPAGLHQVIWDARDQQGNPVPSGLYYYRFQAGSYIQTRKLILMK